MSVRLKSFPAFAILIATVVASASASAAPVEGRDYSTLRSQQRPESSAQVEVIEFFSYGCPHCADLNPQLKAWAAKLPRDTAFIKVPVGFGRSSWASLARAYYALQATGDLERLDQALFDAIHKQRLPLQDEASIAAWVGKQGGKADAFTTAYRSPGVATKVARAEELVRRYQIMEVPKFAVGGRYLVMGESHEQVLANATALAAQAQDQAQRNASR
jgi:protein dithiol oxidoreductase (disulfide-forming)